MGKEIHVENEGVVIPIQVRWLASPHNIWQKLHIRERSKFLVIVVVKGDMVVQGVAKEGFKAAGVWYQVEQFRNVGPDSTCVHSCGWGHTERKCRCKPTCGYC
jgi:hypothetical protein